jgi:molybdenum cofactor biosynthesis enzyme MoaA
MYNLPPQYCQLSYTGGEPTNSIYFQRLLNIVNRGIFKKVVLTTNGYRLSQFLDDLIGSVDHLNISRHHYDDEVNYSVFNTKSVPDKTDLKRLISEVQNRGIDVTLNCVLCYDFNIEKYLSFARNVGANAVSFRKPHGNLDPTEMETVSIEKYGMISESKCPVCRTAYQKIHGFPVSWKASVSEPSKDLNSIYEVIYHPNGKLTADWDGKILVERE